jgi:hypothetical protein
VLRSIKNYDIANKKCSEITSTDVIAFANELIINIAPSTVGNYLSHLAAVFAVAKPAWAYPLDQTAMKDAFVVAKRLGIASKSRERDRRPTLEELDKIMEYFGERLKRRPSSIPMQKVIGFAIFSTRRLEEVARILWKDHGALARRHRPLLRTTTSRLGTRHLNETMSSSRQMSVAISSPG